MKEHNSRNLDLRSCRSKDDNYIISVVIPAFNERENIAELSDSLQKVLTTTNKSYELIFINDGSNDGSRELLEELHSKNPIISVIHLYRKSGKAPALELGIELAKGEYIVIIDCDLQYDVNDIPMMISELDNGYDVITGKRVQREDSKGMIITSRIFNWTVRKITGLKIKDYFSGLKCFKKEVVSYLALFGDLYRFATVYAHKQGFKVKEVPIKHRYRVHGKSKYSSFRRLILGILDIITILFTITFNQNRIYYLSFFGLLLLSLGTVTIFLWLLFFNSDYSVIVKNWNYVGFTMLFLGIQTLILKQVSKDFFVRHQETFYKRRRNIRKILSR